MEIFEYKGRNVRGEMISGSVEAPNTAGVVAWMRTIGLAPVEIQLKEDKLLNQPAWLRALQGARSLNETDLLFFTRQMGTLVKAGVPMIKAVLSLKTSSRLPAMTQLLRTLQSNLDRGMDLSSAMAQHPEFFNAYYVNMVKVGETTGQLDEVFERLYDQLDFDRRMRKKIAAVVRYPAFVFTAIFAALLILMIYVVPSFSKVYASVNMELPMFTKILIGTSTFASEKWWLVIGFIIAMVVFIRGYLATVKGRYKWDRYKIKLPAIGPILSKGTTARFCRSFATAMRSGVPIVQALTLTSKVVDNAYYEERILAMRESVSRGESILRSFMRAELFSPVEMQMISVGEETGDFDGMVQKLAVLYEEEVEYEASKLSETLEPLLLVFMAALVIILLLGIFMPMWNMTQLATR